MTKFDIFLYRVQQMHCSFPSADQLSFLKSHFLGCHFLGTVVGHPASEENVFSLKQVFQWLLLYRSWMGICSSSWCSGGRDTLCNIPSLEGMGVGCKASVSSDGDLVSLCNITCVNAVVHWLKECFWLCDSSSQTWVTKIIQVTVPHKTL